MNQTSVPTGLPETLTLSEVQAALQCCMAAEPPRDFALSPDASLLTDVFGSMRYHEATDQPVGALSEKHQAAVARWFRAAGGVRGL